MATKGDEITAKDGLLWRGDTIIELPEADAIAISNGYGCAEQMVRALKLKRKKGRAAMTSNLLVEQGKVFDVIGVQDLVIQEMNTKALTLKINGIEDKKGKQEVHELRMLYVKTRTSVEKHGKAQRAEALKYQKDVIAEEKRIIDMLAIGENYLSAEEKAVDDAVEAIKQEKERLEAARVQARVDRLEVDYGMRLFGQNYTLPFPAPGTELPLALLKVCTDEQFETFCVTIQEAKTQENSRLEAIEQARLAEQERFAQIAAEQKAERQRLEEEERKASIQRAIEIEERNRKESEIRAEARRIADEKAEWERIKKAEQNAIEAARQKVIDDERCATELSIARKEAAEKARIETEEKAKREAKEKIEREEKARIAAERKAARQPDKQKLLGFADYLDAMTPPTMKTSEAQVILGEVMDNLAFIIKNMRDKAEVL